MDPFAQITETEPWQAAEDAAYERRRPLAVQRVEARLAAEREEMVATYTGRVVQDGGAPLSREEAEKHVAAIYSPETENYQHRVTQEMQAMESDPTLAPPAQPVPPFEITDWQGTEVEVDERGTVWTSTTSGRRVRADERIERRIDPAIEEVEAKHHLHTAHVHPWCPRCHLREARTVFTGQDVKNAWLDDAALLEQARPMLEARVRWWLARHDGVPPVHPVTLEQHVTRAVWHDETGLDEMDPPSWLVDGLIPRTGLGYIIGRDGVKKTFFALDIAMSTITGTPFHGRALDEEAYWGAFFVAGEGVTSFRTRVAAWREARQRPRGEDDAPFRVRAGGVNLYKRDAGFLELLEMAKKHQPDLVVFDTLQRCAQGADQNSAADMAIVTASLDEVKHATGGVVIVIAHTDKGDNDARGSSSIEDDADFVIHLKDRDGVVEARVTKQKDGESGSTLRLVGEAHAGSIALVGADEAPAGREALVASSPRLRIVNALRLAHGEHLDVDAVWRATTTKEAPVAKGHVDNLLREMANAGEVRREQVGARKKALYWLDPVLDADAAPGEPVVAESQEG